MKKIVFLSLSIANYTIIHCQNVGIGTTSPRARLHVADSNILFTAPASLPATGLPAASGAGNRMMWYAAKAAIRAGGISGTQWDEAAIGKYSAAFGYSNRAAGDYAASTGSGNSSSGNASFTAGFSNTAAGTYAAAFGVNTDAQAYGSLVLGRYNTLAGNSTAWVDSDPLFVIGNGYLQTLPDGSVSIERRNAFEVLKNGNININGNIRLADSSNIGPSNQPITMSSDVGILSNLFLKPTYISLTTPMVIVDVNVNVGTYFILSTTVATSPPPNPLWIRPRQGERVGQIAILQVAANSAKSFALCGSCDNMVIGSKGSGGTLGLYPGDVISLIWDGVVWREFSYSKNSE